MTYLNDELKTHKENIMPLLSHVLDYCNIFADFVCFNRINNIRYRRGGPCVLP